MEININAEDLSDILYHLEKEYQHDPSSRLESLIERVSSLRSAKRIFFPSGVVELDEIIMLLMPDDQLFRACRLNMYTADLCRDDYLWKNRILNVFDVDLQDYLLPEETNKQAYISLIDPKTTPLEVAAKKGYLPLIKKAAKENQLTEKDITNLMKLAAKAGNFDIVTYLDKRFAVVVIGHYIKVVDEIIEAAVRYKNDLILDDVLLEVPRQERNCFVYIATQTAVEIERYQLVEKLYRAFPTARDGIFENLVIGNESGFPLLKRLYPPTYQPPMNIVLTILESTSTDVKQNVNIGYLIKLIDIPQLLPDLNEHQLEVIINNIYNKEDLKPVLDTAIQNGNGHTVRVLVKKVPELVDESTILLASTLNTGVFSDLIKYLPIDYPYNRALLKKLRYGGVLAIGNHLVVTTGGGLELTIERILLKVKDNEQMRFID